MRSRIKVSQDDIHEAIARVQPGTELHLKKGRYGKPININGKRGSQFDPIIIRGPKAKIGSNIDFDGYRTKANELAAAHQAAGSFPGVYFLADEAALILKDCQWVYTAARVMQANHRGPISGSEQSCRSIILA